MIYRAIILTFIISSCSFFNRYEDDKMKDIAGEVSSIVKNKYIKPVNQEKISHAMVRAITSELDEYSDFFDVDDYKYFSDSVTNSIGGIGVEINKHQDGAMIMSVLQDSPAQKSGLKTNDIIININGKEISSFNLLEISKLMKGEVGAKITLTVMNNDVNRIISIRRDKISHQTVEIDKMSRMPIIKIKSFTASTSFQMKEVLDKLKKYKPLGLIIDLQGNPGGLMEPALDLASFFLHNNEVIAQILYKNRKMDKIFSDSEFFDPFYSKIPIVIISDEGTASASELFIAAMMDNNRAVLIGSKTFGKGVIQDIIPLNSIPGTAIKLTIAEYLTPNGNKINKVGINPAVICSRDSCNQKEVAEKIITSYY
ncbi:S41 family peptidase [Candidatus Deianiraea vastatrix]|uniref:S41 family phage tail-processing protease n=1 Tax=Candidatus Deianiraea vastatrix TaxID=2163644 RepID=A0A5B8XD96_9RICK|nr:S41 family peptidase [Candidatus Deianiraea vastatrix]QED23302.1 Putative S41 family phage tail-processing protease [Candidatus Deianiraea vastatrix]